MERINLNVPREVRKQLRTIARRRGRSEGETARELLVKAISDEEREEFYRRVEAAYTPEMRKRELEILDAFERAGV